MMMKKFLYLIALLSIINTGKSYAQAVLLKGDSTSRVNLYGPKQLESIEIKKQAPKKVVGNYSTKGYRIQVYSGTDRKAAYDARRDISLAFPQHRAYLTFVSPNYKVRVGDFLERRDADVVSAAIGNLFPQKTIISDIVNAVAKPDKQDKKSNEKD